MFIQCNCEARTDVFFLFPGEAFQEGGQEEEADQDEDDEGEGSLNHRQPLVSQRHLHQQPAFINISLFKISLYQPCFRRSSSHYEATKIMPSSPFNSDCCLSVLGCFTNDLGVNTSPTICYRGNVHPQIVSETQPSVLIMKKYLFGCNICQPGLQYCVVKWRALLYGSIMYQISFTIKHLKL